MGWDCVAYKSYWLRHHFLLVARSDHTSRTRNIKPEVVFKVQKMAWYALFCLIMGPFKGEVPAFARLWVTVRVSSMTGAVWSAILATAGLLVRLWASSCSARKVTTYYCCWLGRESHSFTSSSCSFLAHIAKSYMNGNNYELFSRNSSRCLPYILSDSPKTGVMNRAGHHVGLQVNSRDMSSQVGSRRRCIECRSTDISRHSIHPRDTWTCTLWKWISWLEPPPVTKHSTRRPISLGTHFWQH